MSEGFELGQTLKNTGDTVKRFFLLLKCLIQLDQRTHYQNAIARNLAYILNSPQRLMIFDLKYFIL